MFNTDFKKMLQKTHQTGRMIQLLQENAKEAKGTTCLKEDPYRFVHNTKPPDGGHRISIH